MRELLDRKLKEKKFLIAAHRGTFGANVIDNTYLSMNLALRLGADMVEVDVIKSTDDVLFAFHSGNEEKKFHQKIDLTTMSAKEIQSIEYLNLEGLPSGRYVEKLEDILLKLKGETLINIDRAWDCFPEVFKLITKLEMEKQIIIKSPPSENIVKILKEHKINLMFMPIIRDAKSLDAFLDKDINTVAVEVLFACEDHELNSKEFKEKLKKHNLLLWVNSIKLDTKKIHNFVAGHDDDYSLEHDGESWKWLIDEGADIIQTDWPYFLSQFRENN